MQEIARLAASCQLTKQEIADMVSVYMEEL